jgi:hypothetical protein
MQHERRRQSRKPVEFLLNAYQNGFPRLARAFDLSITGMRLRPLLEPRNSGSQWIEVEFQLPNDPETFFIRGECVYTKRQGSIGVRFIDIPARQHCRLETFLAATA